MEMSYQRSSASCVPFPTGNTGNTAQTSPTLRVEAQREPSSTPQTQGVIRPSIPSTYTLAPEFSIQRSPKTPPRIGTTSSINKYPSIDAIRALYRKYPDIPRTPPPTRIMPPDAPGGLVPPRYRDDISNASPDSPTPDRPRSRQRNISHLGNTSRRKAPLTTDPRRKRPAGADVHVSEPVLMYPDFGPGFIPAEDPAPNLALEIVSRPCDIEKWELPQRE
jgi:hypothetical protein